MKKVILAIVVIALLVIGYAGCSVQPNLVKMDEDVKAKWSEVQNQYQRRADLIPNLVSTVKGAAEHERSTLEAVINARAKATGIQVDPNNITPEKLQEFQKAQGELSSALSRLMVVVEQYPTLKANENFLALQNQLEGTENRIVTARGNYNTSVQQYNSNVRAFPKNLLAGMFGFTPKATFEADAAAQSVPKVEF